MTLRQTPSQTVRKPGALLALALLALLALPTLAHAKPKPAPDHWVGVWATGAGPILLTGPTPANPAPTLIPGKTALTLREIVHTTLPGSLLRVEFTNALGTEPLTIGAAHIALAAPHPNSPAPNGDLALASANSLTFNGASSITIPPGGEAISDPAGLALPASADLVVSLFIPVQPITTITGHGGAFATNFLASGNQVGQRALTAPQTNTSWYFLKSVDAQAPAQTAAVVALGDSITDGAVSINDTNGRWPDVLARRLQSDKKTKNLSVLNEGIGGNRVLAEGYAPSAMARFDREVLALPGVRYLLILESINDIGNAYSPTNPKEVVTADDLIAGLAQLAERAHAHGIKVFGATLTPYMGAGYSSPKGEEVRLAVNAWIRSTKLFDGVIDFEKATATPGSSPLAFNPTYDHGDHLHPNDAGLKAMGDAIDLKLFYPEK